jgi:FKBP-type peptidyl-prolyl cis-trans isomerase
MLAAASVFLSAGAWAQDASLSDAANKAFLAQNAHQPGVIVRPDGLQYRVLTAGTGNPPQPTDQVDVLYTGVLINGHVFDQTQPGTPATFQVYQLIPGWIETLRLMRPGAHWHVVIPSNLAYGEKGASGGAVPPNQTLVFDMELVAVRHARD